MQTVIARVSSNSSTEVIDWRGGDGTFIAKGSFTSGTLLLEASIDGGVSFQACKDGSGVNLSLAADGVISFSIGPCKLRATMSGATVAAGTLQVETLTASTDEVTAFGGNVLVTVTSSLLSSPAVFTVYLPAGLTRTQWMSKIYEQLNASSRLAPLFVVTQGAASNVVLTTLAPAAANDATLNISIANVVSGVTTVAASTNTTAGVLAVKQVETFTVAGTVTKGGRGNVLVTVTAANRPELVGGLAVLVPVASGDTASQVASKVRAALAADRDIGAPQTGFFDVSGTGADVVLTDRRMLANDATMNVAYDNGTSLGLTAGPTAVQTTAGDAGVAAQVVTSTVVGTITASGAGNATVTVTAAGMTGSPKAITVALPDGSLPANSAELMRVALESDAAVSAVFTTSRTNAAVALTARTAAANDATLNVAFDNDTSVGLTAAATSDHTTAGAAGAAQVETITAVASGGVLVDGDLAVTVTGAAIGGSPRKFPVRLTTGMTTATLVATAIRKALNHPDVTTAYTVGATVNADVVLTARSKVANDATLVIAIGPTPGLTAYTTATATTAGVIATPNVLISMQNR